MPEREYIDVKRSVYRRDQFFALCSCGWRGEQKPRKLDAEREGDDHLENEHGQ